MGHRNGIFAVLALAMSSVALAGMVYTDAYTHAAQTEASAYSALTSQVGSGVILLCDNDHPASLDAVSAKVIAQ